MATTYYVSDPLQRCMFERSAQLKTVSGEIVGIDDIQVRDDGFVKVDLHGGGERYYSLGGIEYVEDADQ